MRRFRTQETPRMGQKPVTYWDYIKVEEVLSLQGGLVNDASKLSNDEVMFITIHQVEELWLRLLLRELSGARDLFRCSPVPEQALSEAVRGIDRMTTILQHAVRMLQDLSLIHI